jgi:NADH:ubiquinone oxidoreductase subunit 6 (subunit J)
MKRLKVRFKPKKMKLNLEMSVILMILASMVYFNFAYRRQDLPLVFFFLFCSLGIIFLFLKNHDLFAVLLLIIYIGVILILFLFVTMAMLPVQKVKLAVVESVIFKTMFFFFLLYIAFKNITLLSANTVDLPLYQHITISLKSLYNDIYTKHVVIFFSLASLLFFAIILSSFILLNVLFLLLSSSGSSNDKTPPTKSPVGMPAENENRNKDKDPVKRKGRIAALWKELFKARTIPERMSYIQWLRSHSWWLKWTAIATFLWLTFLNILAIFFGMQQDYFIFYDATLCAANVARYRKTRHSPTYTIFDLCFAVIGLMHSLFVLLILFKCVPFVTVYITACPVTYARVVTCLCIFVFNLYALAKPFVGVFNSKALNLYVKVCEFFLVLLFAIVVFLIIAGLLLYIFKNGKN